MRLNWNYVCRNSVRHNERPNIRKPNIQADRPLDNYFSGPMIRFSKIYSPDMEDCDVSAVKRSRL
jgi:hypothetical protein